MSNNGNSNNNDGHKNGDEANQSGLRTSSQTLHEEETHNIRKRKKSPDFEVLIEQTDSPEVERTKKRKRATNHSHNGGKNNGDNEVKLSPNNDGDDILEANEEENQQIDKEMRLDNNYGHNNHISLSDSIDEDEMKLNRGVADDDPIVIPDTQDEAHDQHPWNGAS